MGSIANSNSSNAQPLDDFGLDPRIPAFELDSSHLLLKQANRAAEPGAGDPSSAIPAQNQRGTRTANSTPSYNSTGNPADFSDRFQKNMYSPSLYGSNSTISSLKDSAAGDKNSDLQTIKVAAASYSEYDFTTKDSAINPLTLNALEPAVAKGGINAPMADGFGPGAGENTRTADQKYLWNRQRSDSISSQIEGADVMLTPTLDSPLYDFYGDAAYRSPSISKFDLGKPTNGFSSFDKPSNLLPIHEHSEINVDDLTRESTIADNNATGHSGLNYNMAAELNYHLAIDGTNKSSQFYSGEQSQKSLFPSDYQITPTNDPSYFNLPLASASSSSNSLWYSPPSSVRSSVSSMSIANNSSTAKAKAHYYGNGNSGYHYNNPRHVRASSSLASADFTFDNLKLGGLFNDSKNSVTSSASIKGGQVNKPIDNSANNNDQAQSDDIASSVTINPRALNDDNLFHNFSGKINNSSNNIAADAITKPVASQGASKKFLHRKRNQRAKSLNTEMIKEEQSKAIPPLLRRNTINNPQFENLNPTFKPSNANADSKIDFRMQGEAIDAIAQWLNQQELAKSHTMAPGQGRVHKGRRIKEFGKSLTNKLNNDAHEHEEDEDDVLTLNNLNNIQFPDILSDPQSGVDFLDTSIWLDDPLSFGINLSEDEDQLLFKPHGNETIGTNSLDVDNRITTATKKKTNKRRKRTNSESSLQQFANGGDPAPSSSSSSNSSYRERTSSLSYPTNLSTSNPSISSFSSSSSSNTNATPNTQPNAMTSQSATEATKFDITNLNNISVASNNTAKPFQCSQCEKSFRRQEHLKRHFRSVHSNERPFECNYCDKKFSRSDNLAQHLRTHKK